ncbi:MAG: type II secretion system protein, partial [Chthoniobacterales bacterium]|nr:type II secretion system protein [Chthoniobacterales bacterium]
MITPRPAARPGWSGRRKRGYTLLEVSLVVAIIVLLVGAVVPLSSG